MVSKESVIAKYYLGKSVFITGATGLCGKMLIFSLILTCPEIANIYVLIREKRGISIQERLHKLLAKSGNLFKHIDNPSQLKKIILIQGDIQRKRLGIKDEDYDTLIDQVSVVFHSAADVTFHANLRDQILTNVGGTNEIINLCLDLKQLDSFTYISTAYCCPLDDFIEEKIYPCHLDPIEVLEIASTQNEMNEQDFLGKFENTYMLTKNLAENLIKKRINPSSMNCAIVRPGVVFTSLKSPHTGWIDSVNGITGAFLLSMVGLCRIYRLNMKAQFGLIPVDIVANTCITAGWFAANTNPRNIKIYNCVITNNESTKFGNFLSLAHELAKESPPVRAVRPIASATTSFWMLPIIFHITRFLSET